MKGIVMSLFADMVIERDGMPVWEGMLEEAGIEGVYTSGVNYDHQELAELIHEGARQESVCPLTLTQRFGSFLGSRFSDLYSHYFESCSDLLTFLESVDSVIHVEVKKLYPDSCLPTFGYEKVSANELVLVYYSERMLCHLAVGLIEASAEYYGESCAIQHESCMHDGDASCRIRVTTNE